MDDKLSELEGEEELSLHIETKERGIQLISIDKPCYKFLDLSFQSIEPDIIDNLYVIKQL